ncbi:MAG TPA: inositol monophosphatase [Candidatus Eisenbergiella merdipullorum]|uniref:Inositol-1-monophosphatase n=1 Tax=Candidatus Eisenbergiella merdipullorum TaxID=2838553 RepID=A0A9D2L1K5_9FIRM|nr:inositol monophosphatase [Candidatus Eisenbergiella merdipullorum]
MQIELQKLFEIVKEGGALFRNREEAAHIRVKGVSDYVTQVDLHVQEQIRTRLMQEWPQVQFMGEEKDNSDIDFTKAVWILDPVDGTTNLIHDFRQSAVSLALYEGGKPVCGVVYQPYTEELFHAVSHEGASHAKPDCGAYLNGKPIHVSGAQTMAESLISIGTAPYEHGYADRNFDLFKRIFLDCQDIRRLGSAAIDLAYVACGRTDAFFEMNLKPWDFAAGRILVEEAGGTVTDFEGNSPDFRKKGSVLGSNGKIGKLLVERYMNTFSVNTFS